MKNPVIIFLVLFAWFAINTCKKGDNSQNQSSPRPAVSISQTPVTILLPNSCQQQQFTITNSGAQGSTLNYTVKDDGALQGYLNITNPSGSLSAGASATIFVNIKPDFENDTGLIDAVLVLNVYTPNASNFKKIPVPVNIKSILSIAPLFLGTWSGTWSGGSDAGPVTVAGTWILNLKTADTVTNTFSGSLTWIGDDAYYLPGSSTPVTEFVNTTITQITFSAWTAPNGCTQSELLIETNPASGYGPYFAAVCDFGTKTVIQGEGSFTTYPSVDDESSGTISGAKK